MNQENILSLITNSTIKLLASDSLEDLYKSVVSEAKKLIDCEEGSLFIEEGGKLKRVHTTSSSFIKIKPEKGGMTETTFKKQTLNIASGDTLKPELKKMRIKSVVLIPIAYKTKTIGVLTMYSQNKEYFDSQKLYILKLFGALSSLAIEKTKLNEESIRAISVRDKFIALASHELRTPLTSINGYIQLLYKKFRHKNTTDANWIKELYKESARLTSLVKDLLDINRIKQGEVIFALGEISLPAIVQTAIKENEKIYNIKNIIFENKIKKGNEIIIGDYDKLIETFSGIISNAIKSSTPDKKIYVAITELPKSLKVSIKDNGHGMSQETINNIFKEEWGMGLVLARHVTTFHHGKLHIVSKQNEGTTVSILLPKAKLVEV